MTKVPKGWDRAEGHGRDRPARTGKRSSPPGKKRLLIKTVTEKRIRDIIEEWSEPTITWERLVHVVNAEFRGDWSRQALMKHKRLKAAYADKKDELRKNAKKSGARRAPRERDGTFEVLKRQIREQREEIAYLRAERVKMLEKIATWTANAYLNGWSTKELDKKLQPPDRGQTDKKR